MGCMDLCSQSFFFLSLSLFSSYTTSKLYQKAEQYVTSLMCFLPSADFVLSKLQKEALEDGAFLVRWSAYNYDHIILAVLSINEVLVAPIAVETDVKP